MNTRILFFGSLAERLGRQIEVELPAQGCTVAELRQLVVQQDQAAGSALLEPGVRASADQAMVRDDDLVRPGQEISFFPILSGG